MAPQTARIEYASRKATFGSVAYDLGREERRYELWTLPKWQPKERTAERVRTREKVVPRAMVEPKDRTQGISLFALISYPVAVIMIVCMVLSYVQLTDVQSELATLETQSIQLEEERKELLIAYESAFNLHNIEEYAIQELGMVKLSDEQIVSTAVERTDKAVVLTETTAPELGFFGEAKAYITALLSYFK